MRRSYASAVRTVVRGQRRTIANSKEPIAYFGKKGAGGPGESDGPTEVRNHLVAQTHKVTLKQREMLSNIVTVQEHENDPAAFVLVHFPGQEVVMGSYHPCGALYECTISLNRARECIARLRAILEEHGIMVRSLGEVMRMCHFAEDREKLKKLSSACLKYKISEKDEKILTAEQLRLTGDAYKNDVVGGVDVRDLVDMIVTQPTVYLEKSGKNTPLKTTGYSYRPLSNLIFTRDQMIVTARGVVLSNLNSAQRSPEVDVIRFCLQKMGLKVIGQIDHPGTLEGGDFYPAGKDLCFIGMGIRTNQAAIDYMLKKKLFGTRRVAVVADFFDRSQARMHLDCIANIASDNCFVVRESVLGELNPKRRLVTEYVLGEDGEYRTSVEHMEFGKYLEMNGWHIIPASEQMADDLGINFINMGRGQIVCCDESMAKAIENFPHFNGKVHIIDYREVCKMYGAVHCTTQVFRTPRPESEVTVMPAVTYPDKAKMLAERVERVSETPVQTTNNVLLVAPTQFSQNSETLLDNDFMSRDMFSSQNTDLDVIDCACDEFQGLYSSLLTEGIDIKLYHHESYHATPDACFPNNWFSTHVEGDKSKVVLYPMRAQSRRRERRPDILSYLKGRYKDVVDLTDYEDDGIALEGTGSMVLDRVNRICYAVRSSRTDSSVLDLWAEMMQYEVVAFDAPDGINMYHTNVMMSIGSTHAIVCFDYVHSAARHQLYKKLKKSGKEIINISKEQCDEMCGNVLELRSAKGDPFLAMSNRAYRAFKPEQLYIMLQHVDHIVHPDYATIERLAGGSVRCSIAELF